MPDADTAGVLAPPPLIYLAGLIAGFAAEALLPSASAPWPLGVVLLVAGAALAASFVRALHGGGTAVDPYKPTSAIVTTGPYRFTRNPGYVALALIYAGIALTAGALWPLATLAIVLVVIDRGVIAREERYLERRFGEEYGRYRARTRRWV